jgi:predicted RNA-binding Zn-ribbon protein involved in translation (DUF1610 family)
VTRKSSAEHKYTCPHCGAVYEVRAPRRGKASYHTATCSYCGDVMAEWNGPARHYHRIKSPRTATHVAKIVAEVASDKRDGRRSRRASRPARVSARSRKRSAVGRKRGASARA